EPLRSIIPFQTYDKNGYPTLTALLIHAFLFILIVRLFMIIKLPGISK
ncbi:unnamed protein product, partial [marine sediment metagenome]